MAEAEETLNSSKEELIAAAKKLEQEEQKKFIEEYNALCDKYGYVIQPKIGLDIGKK